MKEQLAKIRAEPSRPWKTPSPRRAGRAPGAVPGQEGRAHRRFEDDGQALPRGAPRHGPAGQRGARRPESAIEEQGKRLEAKALEARLEAEAVDVTIPGKAPKLGHKHPMYLALDELKDIFIGMGFTVLDGPEVELAEYNFDKLNAEEGHPSRDWSDTFYFDKDSRVMLRSQTSPMQVRAMETMELPIRIIAPGRVYRKDEVDATHSPCSTRWRAWSSTRT